MKKKLVFNMPRNMMNNEKTIKYINTIWSQLGRKYNSQILFDFSNTRQIDIAVISLLVAIMNGLAERNSIMINGWILNSQAEYTYYENKKIQQIDSDWVAYKSFSFFLPNKSSLFEKYLKSILQKIQTFNHFTVEKIISECLLEVFLNVENHTDALYVICSWAFDGENLKFSISNLGKTIKENNWLKEFQSESDVVSWALKMGASSKSGDEVGGLGLYTVLERIKKSGGKLQILSGKGFFSTEHNGFFYKKLDNGVSNNSSNKNLDIEVPFPGTSIMLEFNIYNVSRMPNEKRKKETFTLSELLL